MQLYIPGHKKRRDVSIVIHVGIVALGIIGLEKEKIRCLPRDSSPGPQEFTQLWLLTLFSEFLDYESCAITRLSQGGIFLENGGNGGL